MSNKSKALSILLGMLAALLIIFPSIEALSSQNSPELPASSEKTAAPDAAVSHVLVIPAASFSSDGNMPFNDTFFWFGGGYITGGSNNYGCIKSGVQLPDMAMVYEVFASVYDNDAAEDLLVTIQRINRSGVVQEMANFSTTGASTTIQTPYDATINFPVVSRPEYAYYATICVYSTNQRFYSVRIWYDTINIYLPIMRK